MEACLEKKLDVKYNGRSSADGDHNLKTTITFAAAQRAEKVLCRSASNCVCVRRAATACRINLGGEGNALYPVLSS